MNVKRMQFSSSKNNILSLINNKNDHFWDLQICNAFIGATMYPFGSYLQRCNFLFCCLMFVCVSLNLTSHVSPFKVETHAYLMQPKLFDFCTRNGIAVVAYAPVGSPGRWDKGKEELVLTQDPVVLEIAKGLNKSPNQVRAEEPSPLRSAQCVRRATWLYRLSSSV